MLLRHKNKGWAEVGRVLHDKGGTLVILSEREERLVGYCRTREGPWLSPPTGGRREMY